ncbi:ethanolamine ammonia-lyase reactivating factor EutA [uncultured Pseudoflavonifractor sp.]|uniref:ethanolamine ammonia-lyase reactivating factor EutA n=1 Tax=uncultured Pseudoflavonifractor sp. TaxID=1221379 RepID=UPI0025D83073|nr:ethanolamine ammonia-lyase reactivating factor EutA [uncultured Pseudoflavonifractor sp.]
MHESLLSVGIDIGTSTTQLVISRLTLENRAGPFSVPRIAIGEKEVLYRSAIHFTPLLSETEIDAEGVRAIVAEEYRKSGFRQADISTGAVIITGETARKENARQVLAALSDFAGDFVVATAGPDLESILAARGAGIDEYSKEHHKKILHFDIGGGTSNLALYDSGTPVATGCLDVGGRLVKIERERVTYVSPALERLGAAVPGVPIPRVGDRAEESSLRPAVSALTGALEQAAGLAAADGLLGALTTRDTSWTPPAGVDGVSFSGGVADCIWSPPEDAFAYGDMGVLLGRAIAASPAFQRAGIVRGAETIRATVVGAGSHSTQVSGSTIFYRNVEFPLKNLPVLRLTEDEERSGDALASALRDKAGWFADQGGMTQIALSLRGEPNPAYGRIRDLARGIQSGMEPLLERGMFPVIAVERDMAKVLGQTLWPMLGAEGALLCLDGVSAGSGDYLDIGAPVAGGAVLPVVVKTLAFQSREATNSSQQQGGDRP